MNYEKLSEQVREFVLAFFEKHTDKRLSYHNVAHTESVVAAIMEIAAHYQLSKPDYFAVCAAGWFHDTGYLLDQHEHENKSIAIARDFFEEHKLKDAIVDKVVACIEATRMPQEPHGQLQNIICDADLFHLGTVDFWDNYKQLRKEIGALSSEEISKKEWRGKSIELLQQHHYHTDYCKLLLSEQKEKNLAELIQKQQKAEDKKADAPIAEEMLTETLSPEEKPLEIKMKQGKGKKEEEISKGVQTMFRITASNQQRLSYMADSKAHIMISVNSIIISLLLSLLLRKIDEHPNQVYPAIVLLIVNLVTIVFAILATRPNVTTGTFTQEDVESKQVNLLFFGNYFKMEFEKYKDGMKGMMHDDGFLYGSLIKDLYAQGVVLGRKYHLLRMSYNVFMYGLIVSVVAFLISTLIN